MAKPSFVDLHRGTRGLSKAPIEDIDAYWSPLEQAQASSMLACSIVGDREAVRRGVELFAKRTRADELMIVSDVFDHQARLRSFEIIADCLQEPS